MKFRTLFLGMLGAVVVFTGVAVSKAAICRSVPVNLLISTVPSMT